MRDLPSWGGFKTLSSPSPHELPCRVDYAFLVELLSGVNELIARTWLAYRIAIARISLCLEQGLSASKQWEPVSPGCLAAEPCSES